MSLSKVSESAWDSAIAQLTIYWDDVCERWGLGPLPLIKGVLLWLSWTGLTWGAFALSLAFVEVGERGDIAPLDGLLGGCLIGAAQWLTIRHYVTHAYRWILVNALCWGALALLHIGAIGWIAPETSNLIVRVLFGLFYGFYVGLVLGAGQWWVMRQRVVRAWRWVLLSAGIWSVAIAFGWLTGGVLRLISNLFVSEVIGLCVAWALVAALSGIAVVGMVHQADNR